MMLCHPGDLLTFINRNGILTWHLMLITCPIRQTAREHSAQLQHFGNASSDPNPLMERCISQRPIYRTILRLTITRISTSTSISKCLLQLGSSKSTRQKDAVSVNHQVVTTPAGNPSSSSPSMIRPGPNPTTSIRRNLTPPCRHLRPPLWMSPIQ